jgi:hypothetical protein
MIVTKEPPEKAFADNAENEESPLVRRLRTLKWPDVPPGLRERSWQKFQRLREQEFPREEEE